MNMNLLVFGGRLTRDPQLKKLATTSVCEFGIVCNRKLASGEDEATFIDCAAYGREGEAIARFFRTGKEILIRGRLRSEQWTDGSGAKRSKTSVIVEMFEFVGPRVGQPEPPHSEQYSRPPEEDDIPIPHRR